ncbi:MAG: hypothetical protein AAF488_02595 [Planctomycetota bacterium]
MTPILWSVLMLTLPVGGSQPVELGVVRWHRDFDAAAEAAKKDGKPLLTLFQEVPG